MLDKLPNDAISKVPDGAGVADRQTAPADAGISYIFVQRPPPDREGVLAELLARHRTFVQEVRGG